MPLYDYECQRCGQVTERAYSIHDFPNTIECPECHGEARKIISTGKGGIQCDSINDVQWLPSALKTLQPDWERPIESRKEYNQYLKDNNIIAAG